MSEQEALKRRKGWSEKESLERRNSVSFPSSLAALCIPNWRTGIPRYLARRIDLRAEGTDHPSASPQTSWLSQKSPRVHKVSSCLRGSGRGSAQSIGFLLWRSCRSRSALCEASHGKPLLHCKGQIADTPCYPVARVLTRFYGML